MRLHSLIFVGFVATQAVLSAPVPHRVVLHRLQVRSEEGGSPGLTPVGESSGGSKRKNRGNRRKKGSKKPSVVPALPKKEFTPIERAKVKQQSNLRQGQAKRQQALSTQPVEEESPTDGAHDPSKDSKGKDRARPAIHPITNPIGSTDTQPLNFKKKSHGRHRR
ncbi:hypothetical protein K439DRAFT_903524 [Ramaria rubella]|nr:hypothetical protein K439DRAFT_903524 [Ramaria rubella]